MNLEIVKKHPYVTGGIAIVGVVILYILIKRGSSSSSATVDSSTGSLQFQQIQAATNLQNAQYGSQVEIAQLAGQVASHQADAQVQAVALETAAAQNIVATQTTGGVDTARINADATTQQTQIQADAATEIAHATLNTQLQIANGAFQEEARHTIYNYNTAATVIQDTAQGHLSSTGATKLLSALQGRGPEAIAANQPSDVASSPGNILSSLTKAATSIFSFF